MAHAGGRALLLRERAIVTDIEGTTRDTIEERAEVHGVPVTFIDTAGIRQAGDEAERLGVERTYRAAENCDLALWLRQADIPLGEDEIFAFKSLADKPRVIVFTKCDISREINPSAASFYSPYESIAICSLTGEGIEALRDITARLLHPTEEPAIVTNSRHISALNAAAASLESAVAALDGGLGLDCCATDVKEALYSLGSITGKTASEDIIDAIFSRFCVGK